MILPAAVLLAWPAHGLAQASASATATGSAQIVDPAGVMATAGGSTADLPAAPGPGLAAISGGRYSIRGAANQVVSVTAALPASVERVGGGQTLPMSTAHADSGPTLSTSGAAAFDLAGGSPVQNAPAGVYTGVAQVVVNLN